MIRAIVLAALSLLPGAQALDPDRIALPADLPRNDPLKIEVTP